MSVGLILLIIFGIILIIGLLILMIYYTSCDIKFWKDIETQKSKTQCIPVISKIKKPDGEEIEVVHWIKGIPVEKKENEKK